MIRRLTRSQGGGVGSNDNSDDDREELEREEEEDDDGDDEEQDKRLRVQREQLACKFTWSMSLFGLCEDVSLLLLRRRRHRRKRTQTARTLARIACVALVLWANFMALYLLVAHVTWEFGQHNWTANTSVSNATTTMQQSQIGCGATRGQDSGGWTVVHAFLDNLRRHLSRMFSVALCATWHLGCRRIELLFADVRQYYAMFARGPKPELELVDVAHRRLRWALVLPPLNFLFSLTTVSLVPESWRRRGKPSARRKSQASDESRGDGDEEGESVLRDVLNHATDNFGSFHKSIHTAFHSFEHTIERAHAAPSDSRSAAYALAELLLYSLYYHGPRIMSATCLSLVLHMHHKCVVAFGALARSHVRRPPNAPMQRAQLRELVRLHDLIALMHARIERTFKWSLVHWYSLMFVSCLIQIFSFTESTSVFVSNSGGSGSANSSVTASVLDQQQQQTSAWSTLVMMLVRATSLFFVCYPPCLIYSEAFKLEAASQSAQHTLMLLSRRHHDKLAQSLEPSLFDVPAHLDVGGYFHLNKRSLASFVGAIVTFSVMFIELRTKSTLTNAGTTPPPSQR